MRPHSAARYGIPAEASFGNNPRNFSKHRVVSFLDHRRPVPQNGPQCTNETVQTYELVLVLPQ